MSRKRFTEEELREHHRIGSSNYYKLNREAVLARAKLKTHTPEYRAYHRITALKSKELRDYGARRKDIIGTECVLCSSDRLLVVHHIDGTSSRYGGTPNNSRDNLITLCRRCHQCIHHHPDRLITNTLSPTLTLLLNGLGYFGFDLLNS